MNLTRRQRLRRPRLRSPFHDTYEDDRLGAAIRDCQIRMPAPVPAGADWAKRARDHLRYSRTAKRAGMIGASWSSLKAADRELIGGFDATQLQLEVDRLHAEANEKLTRWRRDAVMAELEPAWKRLGAEAALRQSITDALAAKPSTETNLRQQIEFALAAKPAKDEKAETEELRTRLMDARRVFDEHSDNVYWRIDILRRYVLLAGFALFLSLLAILIASFLGWGVTSNSKLLANTQDLVVVMLLGAVGASVSGVLTPLSRDAEQKIPDARAQRHLTWVRPLLGAGTAVVVVSIIGSGIVGVTVSPLALPVAAIAAGFSERFASRAVAMASATLGK
jgi:hypothetical protein